ncbi:MAG TPA: type II toxin-antitoxin system VapB family antitoxin [Desulfuromonadales bacterium]|nr:type II toxin-antitoxin system VapB family antitoxin [Desulfuromonadales bacterium]
MRATLNIPDDLIHEVQTLSGEKSKTGAIIAVMEAYVKQKKMEQLLALKGKIRIDYDWEKAEAEEMQTAEERERYGEH